MRAAAFPRQNGSGTPIVTDQPTGSWLLALGTWFHAMGYGSGAEIRLLQRYLEAGEERLAQELEGFFILVIGDARTQQTLVLTDIGGSCHAFLRSWEKIVALSGSSLLLAGLGEAPLDPVGCQEYLNVGTIFEDRTIYRHVRKLGPATIYKFAGGALQSERRYWTFGQIAPDSLKDWEAVEALWESLTGAARKIAKTHPRPVLDVTGGYDSRALAAAFEGAGVSFTATVAGPPDNPDVYISKGVSQMMGWPHVHLGREEQIRFAQVKRALPFTDGEFDLIEYAGILRVQQALSEGFDISINGSVGGLARALWWEVLLPRIGARQKLDGQKVARLRYVTGRYDASLFPPESRLDLVAHVGGVADRLTAGLTELPNTLQLDHTSFAMRIQRWQGRIASGTNRLWPCLSPFLLRSVLEPVLQTDAHLRQRSMLVRRMLVDYQPQLANYPLAQGYPAAPLTWKNLLRFWPAVGHNARRVQSKLRRLLGGAAATAVVPGQLPVHLQLWGEEEVREMLHPSGMKLDNFLNHKALETFLERSRQRDFPFSTQWSRLLSLEYTLRALDQLRQKTS